MRVWLWTGLVHPRACCVLVRFDDGQTFGLRHDGSLADPVQVVCSFDATRWNGAWIEASERGQP